MARPIATCRWRFWSGNEKNFCNECRKALGHGQMMGITSAEYVGEIDPLLELPCEDPKAHEETTNG
jgi:hypothetical protein